MTHWSRTRATWLLLRDLWSSRYRCRARFQNTERRCTKERGHGGPHVCGERSWADPAPSGGHVIVPLNRGRR